MFELKDKKQKYSGIFLQPVTKRAAAASGGDAGGQPQNSSVPALCLERI